MKTTIDFPDELLHEAKIVAAQRKTTLKKLVLQGLDHVIRHPEADPDAARRSTMEGLLRGMQATNTEAIAPMGRDEIYDR